MSFENFNNNESLEIPTRDEIINILTNKRIEDPEVIKKLQEYAKAQETLADISNKTEERLEVALHMAEIYFESGYREYAIESLEEILMIPISDDLRQRIEDIYDRFTE